MNRLYVFLFIKLTISVSTLSLQIMVDCWIDHRRTLDDLSIFGCSVCLVTLSCPRKLGRIWRNKEILQGIR